MSDDGKSQSWAAANKKIVAALATATAIVGLATGVLTLRDQLFSDNDEPDKASREGGLTPATASKLSDKIHLSRFEQLLGEAEGRKRLQSTVALLMLSTRCPSVFG